MKGNNGSMGTGTKANPTKGPLRFGKGMPAETSNIVKGKASRKMGVKKGSKKGY
jgi:hypothetical protein